MCKICKKRMRWKKGGYIHKKHQKKQTCAKMQK